MGLGVANGRIPFHRQTFLRQSLGQHLGAIHHSSLILLPESIHFISRHQHAQLGAQMMVGHAAREYTTLNSLPQLVFEFILFPVHRDDAALRAEEGLVGRTGHNFRSFRERILEGRPYNAQHMSHIVHNGGIDALLVHKLTDGRHRLLMQHHTLTEDDEFRLVLVNELLGLFHIDFVDIFLQHREVDDGIHLGLGIHGDVIVQDPHRLGGKVAAPDNVVVHHIAQALGIVLPVQTVLKIHQGGEHRRVGHLAAGDTGLHFSAAEVFLHFLHQELLGLINKLGALVVENIFVVEGLGLSVLRIAEVGIGTGKELHRPAGGVL